jgi:hypothetical protein
MFGCGDNVSANKADTPGVARTDVQQAEHGVDPLAKKTEATEVVGLGSITTERGIDPQDKKADAPSEAGKPTRRALLVGVTKYPKLAPKLQLVGPANDVLLMKTTLVTHFGVPEANVMILSEAEGEKKADRLPTRANIEREFKRLAEIARPGDEIVIMLGGHGSQQPEKPGAPEPEPDGLDEMFLPRDVGQWNDTVGSVENTIIDDDLGDWIGAIRTKKCFIWLVIDACHSGTMMRGEDDLEKPRKSDPILDLAIPQKRITDAENAAAARAGPANARGVGGAQTSIGLGGKPGVFAIYAAQPTETTPERPMPPSLGKDGTQHGVLTFTICQILTQAKAAGSPLSYRELGLRIQQQYTAWGRTGPTPMVEYPDTDPDREVLGPGVWKDRAKILLSGDPGAYKVNAGQLLGLTPGSILKVIPPPGMGEQILGHVKVTATRPIDADVEPCEYDKKPALKELPVGGRCAVVFVDYGEVQMRVAVATHYPSTKQDLVPVPPELRAALVARLKKGVKPEAMFRLVDDPRSASWMITPLPDGRVSLMPAGGWAVQKDAGGKEAAKSTGYGPVPTDNQMVEWLEDALGRIGRADGLVQMAADRSQDLLGGDDLAPKLKVELLLRDDTGKPTIKLPWPATDLTVYDKDRVVVQVTNTGRVPFDLTLLYVDSDHAIAPQFPKKGVVNRVFVKDSLPASITINSSTIGLEHVVLIAVKADGPQVDFLNLAQKGPEKVRDVAARGDGPQARMAKLFDRRVYGGKPTEGTRGAAPDTVADHTMSLISWQVKGTTRPKK